MRKDIATEKIVRGVKLNKTSLVKQYNCCWRTIKRLNPEKYKKEKTSDIITII